LLRRNQSQIVILLIGLRLMEVLPIGFLNGNCKTAAMRNLKRAKETGSQQSG